MKFALKFVLLFCVAFVQAQSLKIGVITDLEQSPDLEMLLQGMLQEIDQTTGVSRQVSLVTKTFGISDWESAQRSYRQLESQVDLVIALGSVTAKSLSLEHNLSIPVIALGIVDPNLQEIPYVNGTSGKRNYTYIWQTRDLEKELGAFNTIHDINNVVVFVDEKTASTVDESKAKNFIDSLSQKLDAELSIIPIGQSVEHVINQLPVETDAVYFTAFLSQTESQIRFLVNQLNERKIPTFTGNGRLMNYGVLGSMANENDLNQVMRKLAIMVDGIVSGSNLSSMPVALDTKENLYVNLATARKIQLAVPFEVLFTATLKENNDGIVKTYSFEEIVERSLTANLDIQISYQNVELSKVQVKSANSNLLPSLESGITASQINEDRASAIFNNPEKSVTANLTFTQLIYSEQAIAAVKITKYLQKAQEYYTEAEVLQVLLDTYTAYLNVLSAKTNMLIQRENLSNTRKNRELASVRVNLGSTNNTDLFRWDSELAIATQSVIDAQTKLLAAKLQLNTLLANTLESEFDVEDLSLEGDLFKTFSQSPIAELVNTPQSLRAISDFLVEESQRRNPNKKALEENINAANRQLTQNKRSLYVPTVAFKAQTTEVLHRGGAGSTLDAGAMALGMTEQQSNSWFAGISISFPIFDGLGRKAAIQQSKINLNQLDYSQTLLDQKLELGIRASVLDLLSATTNIRFSKSASANAHDNFELVQENYKQGQVTITQLIDAQERALEARLASAFSVYKYIQYHLQLEFNVGSFMMLMPEEQRQDFNDRLQQYLNN